MNYRIVTYCFASLCLMASSCAKWEDKPATNPGLTNKYCNIATAINFNHGFPGIEDSTICVFPVDPYVGNYSFMDSIYYEADTAISGAIINFNITAKNRTQLTINNFCSNSNQLLFTADRYYRAASDSVIGQGIQLMCRTEDTLSGTLEYRPLDSSIYLEFKVISDTGTSTHRGRAYKK